MIPRYSRPEMARLWTPENRYQSWLRVELAAANAMAEAGLVPRDAVAECERKAPVFTAADAERIDEIEKVTRHDVIAFLTFLEERIGPAARHLHFGMTSSDVLDTSLAMLLRDAADLLLAGVDEDADARRVDPDAVAGAAARQDAQPQGASVCSGLRPPPVPGEARSSAARFARVAEAILGTQEPVLC